MDLFIDPEMPHPLKIVIWTAVAVVSIATIIKQLRNSRLLQFVAKELSNDSGNSVKDIVSRQDRRGRKTAMRVKNLATNFLDIRLEMRGIEYRQARLILHQKANDLSESKLLKEAEEIVKNTPAEVKEASVRHPLHWGVEDVPKVD